MKRIFSIFVATLLLSTTLLAQNVAKVTQTADGTPVGEYPTMAEALAAWTDGTTLTMLDNATYNATATHTVSGTQTLDLAGKTLTWDAASSATGSGKGKYIEQAICVGDNASLSIIGAAGSALNFSCIDGTNGTKAIYVGKNAKKLSIGAVSITANFAPSNAKRSDYAIYCLQNGELSIVGTTINVSDYVKGALYIETQEDANMPTLSDITINYDRKGQDPNSNGVYAIEARRVVKLENCAFSLENVPSALKCYSLYSSAGLNHTISGAKTRFAVNGNANSAAITYSSSSQPITLSIENGVFIGPIAISAGSVDFTFKTNISADAKFSSEPWAYAAPEGKVFAKIGGTGEYKDYWCVTDGAYRFTDGKLGYMSAKACLDVIPDNAKYGSTFVVLTATEKNDFEVPANKKINFYEKADQMYNGTITNKGTISFKGKKQWDNTKVINYGTVTLDNADAYYLDGFMLENQEGGTITVTKGYFTDKSLSQVNDFLSNGYIPLKEGDYWKITKSSSIVAKVGETTYTNLNEALMASSAESKAVLARDYYAGNGAYSFKLNNGVDAYLDLNGHTLTLPKLYGAELQNAHLTISNGTLNCTQSSAVDLIGSAEPTAQNYTTLTINSDVIVKQASGEEYFVSISEGNLSNPYGIVVNFNGTYEGQCPFYVNGSLITIADNAPTFNIGSTAKFTSNSLAYAAGYGIWNYSGEATTSHHGFELRAGKLTMNGGSIVCTATKPADDQFNGNGSTSQACAIAVCQHSTQLPASVVINGGELKAYTPIYQANPQNNPQEAIDKVSVEVNNAKVFSTSKNIVWSANKKVVLNGGVYNLSPAAYIAEGKAVVENTNPDTKEMYPYTIGKKAAAVESAQAGNWNEAATWVGGAVPTAATPVVMKHAVVIPANIKAEVMGMDVQGGAITVEGTLVIGNDGIKGITNANQLLVKDGGALVISPVATKENSQPLATVELKTVIRDVKDEYAAGDRSYEYIWQNIGLPVTSMTITPAKTLTVNTWDIMSAWIPATEFGTAFRGYHITNMNNKTAGVLYTFAGQLVGNQNATLSMPRDGFHFFGNSWMAPFDVKEILNQLNSKSANGVVTPAVYVYVSDKLTIGNKTYNDGQYMDITLAQLDNADYAAALGQIAAMQGFFLHSDGQANISLNYEKAVWNATLAKPAKASKYTMEEATAVRISLTAENGRSDEVYLYEGEAFAAPKMMNVKPNVNIYAITANGTYSTMGLDKVEGTQLGIQTNAKTNYTISFDWLKGETLYLKDKKENKYIAMTEGTTYSFTAEANTTIDNRFEIVGKSNVPTMMENTESNIAATGIYSITGQYIGETTMWNTLPAGLYIVNGQKRVK